MACIRTVSVLESIYSSMRNQQTPLGPTEQAALERLFEDYGPVTDSFSRAVAVTALADLDCDSSAAHNILDQLLSKGYLYAVNDELHITDSL